jgi:UDP-3-O-[3-hydroxymyristoyl] glucosamine N-acyltransferase
MSGKRHYSLQELAKHIHSRIEGDSAFVIEGLASLSNAKITHLAFYTGERHSQSLKATKAGCVLLNEKDRDKFSGNKLISTNPYLDYARLSALFVQHDAGDASIHPSSHIAEDVSLGADVTVGPNVVIGPGCKIGAGTKILANSSLGANTIVGKNTVIYANVSIYHGVTIGDCCTIHSAAVIGADGFGFAPSADGWQKIYQLGGVDLGDNVEIGASTTIDRGALDNTAIGNGVKIDNQVQIGHNVNIGDNTAIASSTAIAGSTIIGKRCTIAGMVGIVGHITITDDVHISGMTMVSKSIKVPGSYSSGVPMSETSKWRKNAARFNQLDAMARKIK